MARPCPSCRFTSDTCSYPGESRPGCLLDKRKRDEINASVGTTSIRYSRAKVKLRALFPDATRIDLTATSLEVQGIPLLPLPSLSAALLVLAKVWGEGTHVAPEFSADRELLRIVRGQAG